MQSCTLLQFKKKLNYSSFHYLINNTTAIWYAKNAEIEQQL